MEEKQELPMGLKIRRINSEIFRIFKKRIRKWVRVKLTIDEYGLLLSINREADDVIQKNMAEAMGKDQSAILKLTDSLEKKELVRRIPGTDDRRRNYLMITKLGKKVLAQYLEVELDMINDIQREISEEEIEIFYKILDKIKNRAETL